MTRGPRKGRVAVDHVAKAAAAWGNAPDWVMTWASEANRIGGPAAAKAVGYSPSVLSDVLANKYGAGLERIEAMVRGRFLGATHPCPGLGREIGTDRCHQEQKRPFSSASPAAIRLYAACRTCPHATRGN